METPPLYNPAREEERPLPNILPPAPVNAVKLIEQARVIPCFVVVEQNVSIAAFRIDDKEQQNDGVNGDNQESFEPLIENVNENQEFENDPLALIKEEPLEPVHDDDIDEIANDIIYTEDAGNDTAESENQDVNQATLEKNIQNDEIRDEESAENENNDVHEPVVFEKFNEDVSIPVGEMPLPIFVGLQLKTSDDFSGNIRFVEFVSLFA